MLYVVHVELAEANCFVSTVHRHHKPVQGHRFSIGVRDGAGVLRGVAIVGRPVARLVDASKVVEVTRVATDGTPHACSALYAAAARAGRELGYEDIRTFILDSEPGTSLRAAGWEYRYSTAGGDWNRAREGHSWAGRPIGKENRRDQPMGPKQCWGKVISRSGVLAMAA